MQAWSWLSEFFFEKLYQVAADVAPCAASEVEAAVVVGNSMN